MSFHPRPAATRRHTPRPSEEALRRASLDLLPIAGARVEWPLVSFFRCRMPPAHYSLKCREVVFSEARIAPVLSLALIHCSAWNAHSRKFVYGQAHVYAAGGVIPGVTPRPGTPPRPLHLVSWIDMQPRACACTRGRPVADFIYVDKPGLSGWGYGVFEGITSTSSSLRAAVTNAPYGVASFSRALRISPLC